MKKGRVWRRLVSMGLPLEERRQVLAVLEEEGITWDPEEEAPGLRPCPACGWRGVKILPAGMVQCLREDCALKGPILDPDGAKWNALPRRNSRAHEGMRQDLAEVWAGLDGLTHELRRVLKRGKEEEVW